MAKLPESPQVLKLAAGQRLKSTESCRTQDPPHAILRPETQRRMTQGLWGIGLRDSGLGLGGTGFAPFAAAPEPMILPMGLLVSVVLS